MMDEAVVEALHQRTKLLPQEPGVYIMKNAKGQIIYIGKAKYQKNRVSSYFRSVEIGRASCTERV